MNKRINDLLMPMSASREELAYAVDDLRDEQKEKLAALDGMAEALRLPPPSWLNREPRRLAIGIPMKFLE